VVRVALLFALAIHGTTHDPAAAQEAVVQGVLAYDPSCENCEIVLEEILPPLEARYGPQLDIVKVDVSTVRGFDIWLAGAKAYDVPAEKRGVPLLFLGDRALSGETEISEHLASAVEAGIAAGGVAFHDSLVMGEAERAMWAGHRAAPDASESKRDPVADGLAMVVLAGTAVGLVFAVVGLWRARPLTLRRVPEHLGLERSMAIPLVAACGLLVSGYLSYLHLSSSDAICPVGNCDAVQHSAWAQLFGMPIAYYGVLAYGAFLGAWLLARYASGQGARLSNASMLGIAMFGTAFSAYLTVLELFVIHAVCMWCLVSAVVMTLGLVAAAVPLHRNGHPTAVSERASHRIG
jgi:uncharacterized membrane protein